MRMSNEKRIEMLEEMENHELRMRDYWNEKAMWANNYIDSEEYLTWSEYAYGKAQGYYFARQLFVDNTFAKDMYKLHVGGNE